MSIFSFVDCCRILTLDSTGPLKELRPTTLGVYKHEGYSNSKMYYKNDHSNYLHYAPVGEWKLSQKSSLGTNPAQVDSDCVSACPSMCKNYWKTFNNTGCVPNCPWEKDATVTIKCAGGYLFSTVHNISYNNLLTK